VPTSGNPIVTCTTASIAINDVTKAEGNSGTTSFEFTITRSGDTTGTSTVNFATADGTATLANSDYTANSGLLTFTAGQTIKTVTVLVTGDTSVEPNETFFVNLSGCSACSISDNQGLGTITNDDSAVPSPTTLSPSKDSYLRKVFSNTNEGDNENLLVAFLGSYRTIVAFDQPQIAAATQGKTLQSAKLNLYINKNFNDWGSSGRDIEVRPLLSSWTEGNGINEFIPIPKVGTGSGVTWNCATDSNISNYKADCSKWNGGKFGSATNKVKITNGLSGWISLDVTSDVKSFLNGAKVNNGWIIKKVDETKLGLISFSSSESSSNKPALVLTFGP